MKYGLPADVSKTSEHLKSVHHVLMNPLTEQLVVDSTNAVKILKH